MGLDLFFEFFVPPLSAPKWKSHVLHSLKIGLLSDFLRHPQSISHVIEGRFAFIVSGPLDAN